MPIETTIPEQDPLPSARLHHRRHLALAVLDCPSEPWRVGERILLEEGSVVWLGRGVDRSSDRRKGAFFRVRPSGAVSSPPLASASISRYQLRISTPSAVRCVVSNCGRCPVFHNGQAVNECSLELGDTLRIGGQLLLLAHQWVSGSSSELEPFDFGTADRDGIVGESQAAWKLRAQLAFAAARLDHVLIHGPSGSGKELVAQAIHARSSRGTRPIVARNAATLPEGLIDAELFGNAKNYPNAGMAGSPGLIGDAAGSSLFLDEFAEMPLAAQAHLLRVLDAGEYHRLGESKARIADLRLIAATNRNLDTIRHDVRARFALTIEVPGLEERREDIPLLVRHLLRVAAQRGDAWAQGFFPSSDCSQAPGVPIATIERLVRRQYEGNVRELRAALWQELRDLAGDEKPSVNCDSRDAALPVEPECDQGNPAASRAPMPSARMLQEALDANHGNLDQTWRALGLASRYALYRLIKKHGLELRKGWVNPSA